MCAELSFLLISLSTIINKRAMLLALMALRQVYVQGGERASRFPYSISSSRIKRGKFAKMIDQTMQYQSEMASFA